MLEVRAHDMPGLLYSVASALTTLGVSVISARVHTLGAEAVDVFYVQAADGSRAVAGQGPGDRGGGGSGAGLRRSAVG